jgi:hypothetical protein
MCNDGTTHLYQRTTQLPTVSKTAFGEGTPVSRSQRAQERETCTMLSGFGSVEEEMAMIGNKPSIIRAKEDGLFAESLRQAFGRSIFYDNRAASTKDIFGFATLLNTLGGVKARNVISCGGATANQQTSFYIANWGDGLYGIFPEGTTAGYRKKDLGRQVTTLANGNKLVTLDTQHLWWIGLCNPNWTDLVRICNIDVPSALALTNNQAPTSFLNVLHAIIRGQNRIRNPGKKVGYCNDTVYELLMRLALEKSAPAVMLQEAAGQFGGYQELSIMGMPVRKMDSILNTEAIVT